MLTKSSGSMIITKWFTTLCPTVSLVLSPPGSKKKLRQSKMLLYSSAGLNNLGID